MSKYIAVCFANGSSKKLTKRAFAYISVTVNQVTVSKKEEGRF